MKQATPPVAGKRAPLHMFRSSGHTALDAVKSVEFA